MAPYCDICNGPSGCESGSSCCWARAMAIKKFKKRVLYKYIFEVIFDVIVSVLSVITDILSIVLYFVKGRWVSAVVTGIPVLLPTIVFTNVYLADETKGYCVLPKKRTSKPISEILEESSTGSNPSLPSWTSSSQVIQGSSFSRRQFHDKFDYHCGACHSLCFTCTGCLGAMFKSCFHYDQSIRINGLKVCKKSVKRFFKYFLGTFVLRFISLAWYAKALFFGIRAYREPKKYMKLALPSAHWSYDLLVKLDFLQAALENAPQCVIQLYALLIYPDEIPSLGILTLFFSFLDFVRVSISVQWDIHKGPVIAPTGCYGSYLWKFMNMSSWIFVYMSRSAALALVIATVQRHWSVAIPIVILVFHTLLFAKLFSQAKYGVAAQKIMVSVFISFFFLPEFYINELSTLTQFYYAVIHVENVFFIVPWNGFEHQYCIKKTWKLPQLGLNPPPALYEALNITIMDASKVPNVMEAQDCLIDPTVFIILIPTLTMIGIVMRLAASKRMTDYKNSLPARPERLLMEERIAKIYRKKWSKMTFDSLFQAFLRMLKKEVLFVESETKTVDNGEGEKESNFTPKESNEDHTENAVYFISPSLNREFKNSQRFLLEAISFLSNPNNDWGSTDGKGKVRGKTQRSMSVDGSSSAGLSYRGWSGKTTSGEKPSLLMSITETTDDDESLLNQSQSLDLKRSKSHDNFHNFNEMFLFKDDENEKSKNLFLGIENSLPPKELDSNFEFFKVESPEGPYLLEKTWI